MANNAIIFDSETTGLSDPEIIESAFVRLDWSDNFNHVEAGYSRYKPSKPIELGAMAIHNIMDEDLENESLRSIDFKLPDNVQYLIGHNIDFDWTVIGKPDVFRIDTLALSRHFWPELESHKQSAMLYHLERSRARDLVKNAHCALDDVMNCSILLSHIINAIGYKPTWKELWDLSEVARIPIKMPFGKYYGRLIKDVPNDYIRWLKKQPDLDPYLLKALK